MSDYILHKPYLVQVSLTRLLLWYCRVVPVKLWPADFVRKDGNVDVGIFRRVASRLNEEDAAFGVFHEAACNHSSSCTTTNWSASTETSSLFKTLHILNTNLTQKPSNLMLGYKRKYFTRYIFRNRSQTKEDKVILTIFMRIIFSVYVYGGMFYYPTLWSNNMQVNQYLPASEYKSFNF